MKSSIKKDTTHHLETIKRIMTYFRSIVPGVWGETGVFEHKGQCTGCCFVEFLGIYCLLLQIIWSVADILI